MTTDALLGGIETVRDELLMLIEFSTDSHPDVSSRLSEIDGELEELEMALEGPGLEEELWLEDGDLEVLTELREEGFLTPADFFDPFDGED